MLIQGDIWSLASIYLKKKREREKKKMTVNYFLGIIWHWVHNDGSSKACFHLLSCWKIAEGALIMWIDMKLIFSCMHRFSDIFFDMFTPLNHLSILSLTQALLQLYSSPLDSGIRFTTNGRDVMHEQAYGKIIP